MRFSDGQGVAPCSFVRYYRHFGGTYGIPRTDFSSTEDTNKIRNFIDQFLALILLTWATWRAATNASKWRMGFNSAFKGLNKGK